ncbi:hypothetical protein ABIE51_001421 [Lysobacter sp. OAE881]
MHSVRFQSPIQLASRLCAKARHAEPQLRSRRRSDRIEANARIRETERELRSVLWGAAALSHSVKL